MNRRGIFISFALFTVSVFLPAQTIWTVAGIGSNGFSGDSSNALDAELAGPDRVAMDQNGMIYFSDSQNNRIRRVDLSGVITTICGTGNAGFSGDGGPAISADINAPMGIAFDANNDLYFADYFNNRIRKIDQNGNITTVAGNGTATYMGDGSFAVYASLNHPRDVTFKNGIELYIADSDNHRVRKVTAGGIISTYAGTGMPGYSGDGNSAIWTQLNHPSGICFNSAGELFIADELNHRVRKISTTGFCTTIAGNGVQGFSGDSASATSAELNTPCDVDWSSAGDLFICDKWNNRIRKCDINGMITTYAGGGTLTGEGDLAVNSLLHFPTGIYYCGGELFIAEYSGNKIRNVYGVNGIPESPSTISIQTYPDPATDNLFITFNLQHTDARAAVFSSTGELLMEFPIGNSNSDLDIRSLPPGIYTLRIVSEKQFVGVSKFIRK